MCMPELTSDFLKSNSGKDVSGKFVVSKENKIFLEQGVGTVRHSMVADRNKVNAEDVIDAGTFVISQDTVIISGGSMDFSITDENNSREATAAAVENIAKAAGFSFMRINPRD